MTHSASGTAALSPGTGPAVSSDDHAQAHGHAVPRRSPSSSSPAASPSSGPSAREARWPRATSTTRPSSRRRSTPSTPRGSTAGSHVHPQPREPGPAGPPGQPGQGSARCERRRHGRRRHTAPPLAPNRHRPRPAERDLGHGRRTNGRVRDGPGDPGPPRDGGLARAARGRQRQRRAPPHRVDLPTTGRARPSSRVSSPRWTPGSRRRAAKVDTANHDAARMWKLYGTVSRKGDPIPDRPHRRSAVIAAPEPLEVVPAGFLRALAAVGAVPPAAAPVAGDVTGLRAWLEGHGIIVTSEKPWQGGTLLESPGARSPTPTATARP